MTNENKKMKMEVEVELKEGVSSKTNNPYHFYAFTIMVNGFPVELKPKDGTSGKFLELYFDSQM